MKTLILTLITSMLLTACTRNNPSSICDKKVTIDGTLFKTVDTTNYYIIDAKVNGDCLEIKFGSSGCSGDTWIVELVDAGAVMESRPEQRALKLSLINNEMCKAAFQKTISFDIRSLKVQGSKKIILNLQGGNRQIIYSY